jgi:hypothetical protein
VDAIFGTPERPIAIFELKTGGARLTAARMGRIWQNLPHEVGKIPIIGIRPRGSPVKRAEVHRLVRTYLLPELPGFAVHSRLLFHTRIEYLLRGFCFEPSGFESGGFYVWVFVQPLYIPSDNVLLTYGDRLGGGSMFWKPIGVDESSVMRALLEAMGKEGLPVLERIKTPSAFAAWRSTEPIHRRGMNRLEAQASALILAGNHRQGAELLDEIERRMPEIRRENIRLQLDRPWVEEIANRARTLRAKLDVDLADAIKQLTEWRDYTIQQLKLEKFALEPRSPLIRNS